MKNNKILEVKNLSKVFSQKGSLLVAVDNVSFDLEKGETIGLIGESGSGKTTIGRTIIKLHNPSSGRILINGTDVAAKKLIKEEEKILRSNIQMIFQDPYSSLNEQKNIMNIVSEPIKVLKLDKKYINDLYEESEKVYKFFGFALIDYFYEKMFEFRKYANNVANNTYKKIINNLDEITFSKNSKEENLKLLLSNYFQLKQKANFDIINKMLSISNDIFTMWRECQTKIKKGDLDLELEKKLLNSMLEYENALDHSKFSKKYIKLKNEVEDIRKEKQSFEEFLIQVKHSSQKNIKNVILEWENKKKLKLLNAKKTETFSAYNFIYLDYLIIRKICSILKKLKKANVLFDGNISEKTQNLYNSLKEELKDKFEEFKNINNKSIKFEIKNIENINKKVNDICNIFQNNSSFISENNVEYIYNDFLKKHATLNVPNLQQLNKLLESKVRDRDLEKNKDMETLVSEKELEKFRQKYEAAEKVVQDDLANFKTKHNLKIQLLRQKRAKILTKQNNLLDQNRIKSQTLFSNRLNEFFNLKLDDNFKRNILFKKRVLKEVKTMQKNNASLEKEMNQIQKDLNVIKAFITRSSNVKLKIKKMVVRNKVFKALEDSGLTKAHAFRYPHEFSGGMRQRVGIARAIITQPKIIIADEPIAALDLSIQAQIINMLKNLQKRYNMSMIFIAHDLSMVRYISDKILIIHLGKIVEFGKTKEIFENPIHPYTKNLLASMPDISKISKGFQEENFEPKYLEKYSSINSPEYYDITQTHKVLADKEQFKEWSNETTITKN